MRSSRLGTAPCQMAGRTVYVVGNNLVFETQDLSTISAIGLYRGSPQNTGGGSPQAYAHYVTANETACVSA